MKVTLGHNIQTSDAALLIQRNHGEPFSPSALHKRGVDFRAYLVRITGVHLDSDFQVHMSQASLYVAVRI